MATLVKPKPTLKKVGLPKKKHSIIEAFGIAQKKGFDINVKKRDDIWAR